MEDINKDIEILEYLLEEGFEAMCYPEAQAIEHLIKAYKELEYKYNKALSDLVQADHKNKELEEENKELISDNLDYQRTLDIFDKRTYRKKYLEERRKEEPNLLYPDADEIYKRYYKLREENKELKKDNKREELKEKGESDLRTYGFAIETHLEGINDEI